LQLSENGTVFVSWLPGNVPYEEQFVQMIFWYFISSFWPIPQEFMIKGSIRIMDSGYVWVLPVNT
jgi:hypothetical protein